MKTLNRSGFTLVELLGVIVILSVVVGITVPVSTKVITDSKYKSLGVIVDEAEDFITDQWKLKKVDPASMTDSFKAYFENKNAPVGFVTVNNSLLVDMAIDKSNVSKVDVMIDSDDIACVVISRIPAESNLYNKEYWTLSEDGAYATPKQNNDRFYSKCCKLENVLKVINEG